MSVDISDVMRLERQAERDMAAVPKIIFRELERAAQDERNRHRYVNRTGNLEASTYAAPFADGGELGARAHYAGYVAARGLSRIHQLAGIAANVILAKFEANAAR